MKSRGNLNLYFVNSSFNYVGTEIKANMHTFVCICIIVLDKA